MPLTEPVTDDSPERVLRAYLLGSVDFDSMLALQRQFHYEVSGERHSGVLVLCEHSGWISMGRQASTAQIRVSESELKQRNWPIRWIPRGGGSCLHLPGQLAGYCILSLDALGLNVKQFLDHLYGVLEETIRDFPLTTPLQRLESHSGLWIGDRQVAQVGVHLRDWVSTFGFTLNLDPDLEWYQEIDCDGCPRPMTSLARELRVPIRPGQVRQRLLEKFSEHFAFARTSLFHQHPRLQSRILPNVVASRSRESA